MQVLLTTLQAKKIKSLSNIGGALLHQTTVAVMMPNGNVALIDPSGQVEWKNTNNNGNQ